MITYRMSKECDYYATDEERIKELKNYSVEQLLYLLREIENSPYKYSEAIKIECYSLLYDNNIFCI